MSVEISITCDRIGCVVQFTALDVEEVSDAREDAALEGWTRQQLGADYVDHCPAHSEAS
jgi:hypothetical protein